MSMILHCGGRKATWEEVGDVKLPDKTSSYVPVPHTDFIRLVHDRARVELRDGCNGMETDYALNKDGNQLFFKTTFPDIRANGSCLSIGGRNSYDKSMSVGFALGFHVFICDNMAFTSDFVHFVRQHTGKVWDDIEMAVMRNMARADEAMRSHGTHIQNLKNTEMDQDEGYRMIGLAQGQQLLSPTQSSIAFRSWRKPKFEDFEARTAWSLHNSFTEAGKKFSPAKIMNKLVSLDDLIQRELLTKELIENDQRNRVEAFAESHGLGRITQHGNVSTQEEVATERDPEVIGA